MLWGSKKRTIFVGLEINETSSRILVLTKNKNSSKVEAYATGTGENPVAALQNAKKQLPIKIKTATIAVANHQTYNARITLEKSLTTAEIITYLTTKMQTILQCNSNELAIDFHLIGENAQQKNYNDFNIFVTRKKFIDPKLIIAKSAKIAINSVTITSQALAKVLAICELPQTSILVINFKEQIVEFYLYHKQNLLRTQVYALTKEELCAQLKQLLQNFFALQVTPIEKILLIGELPKAATVAKKIETITNIDTQLLNPFSKFKIARNINAKKLAATAHSFAVCLGLGLGAEIYD